jgi:4-hydroxy-tetrahydrodipicolinate synthase
MGKKFYPQGVMPALVTPFSKDGDMMEESFRQVIDYTIEKGATGVVPAGTTGEFVYMRTEERKKLLRLTVDYVDGRVPVVAGTGQNSTRATIELTKYAADIGCDAALVISPFYLRPGDKGYFEHYQAVALKGGLPVIAYNIPQCTLGWLQSNVLEDLSEIDTMVGVKDSSGSIGHTVELIQKLRGKMSVLIGHDECFLSAVAAGAEAAILASGNFMPHIWLDIMEKVKEGKFDEARDLQLSVQTLARIITRHGGAPPAKAALRMMGIDAGRARMPLNSGGTLTVELKDEIRIELEKLGLVEAKEHKELKTDLNVLEAIQKEGFQISNPEKLRTSKFHNDTISVGVTVGDKTGDLGRAFVKLLTTPRNGHEALTIILEPNLPVKPSSIMWPARRIKSMRQASMFYGPVQSGAAKAISRLLGDNRIPEEALNSHVILIVADIDLNYRDRRVVTHATEEAVHAALREIWR